MKSNYSLSYLVLFIVLAAPLSAQNNSIKLSLLTHSKLSLTYERSITANTSISVGLSAINSSTDVGSTVTWHRGGYFLTGEFRVYPFKKFGRMNGFYSGATISRGNNDISHWRKVSSNNNSYRIWLTGYESTSKHLWSTELGINLGFKKCWKWFTLDGGLNLSKSFTDDGESEIRLANKTLVPLQPSEMRGFYQAFYIGLGVSF